MLDKQDFVNSIYDSEYRKKMTQRLQFVRLLCNAFILVGVIIAIFFLKYLFSFMGYSAFAILSLIPIFLVMRLFVDADAKMLLLVDALAQLPQPKK